eukprot:EST42148.1 SET domain-containing protein [Spironucleus salmonicida]
MQEAPQEFFSAAIQVRQTQTNKGRGIFAKQIIPQGSLIIASQAVVCTDDPTSENVEALFSQIEPTLTTEQREDFARLQKSHGPGICSAFSTNAYKTVPNLQSSEKVGLFLKFSFMNHSCCPSAVQLYDGDQVYVITTKIIFQDDEITTSYLHGDNFWWVGGRQNYLKQFNFTCDCELCMYQETKSYIDLQVKFDKILKQKRNKQQLVILNDVYMVMLQDLLSHNFPMVDGFYESLIGFIEENNTENCSQIIKSFIQILKKLSVSHKPDFAILVKVLILLKRKNVIEFEELKQLSYQFELDRIGQLDYVYRKFKKQVERIGMK